MKQEVGIHMEKIWQFLQEHVKVTMRQLWLLGQILHHHHGRIMIDFIDPLIVAERIATTENTKYLTIRDIKDELRDGEEGVGGIGSMGKKRM